MIWYPIVNQYSIFNFCLKNQNYAIKGPVREYSGSCADFVTYYKNMNFNPSDVIWYFFLNHLASVLLHRQNRAQEPYTTLLLV